MFYYVVFSFTLQKLFFANGIEKGLARLVSKDGKTVINSALSVCVCSIYISLKKYVPDSASSSRTRVSCLKSTIVLD